MYHCHVLLIAPVEGNWIGNLADVVTSPDIEKSSLGAQ